jgi:hypothetical protein
MPPPHRPRAPHAAYVPQARNDRKQDLSQFVGAAGPSKAFDLEIDLRNDWVHVAVHDESSSPLS